MSPTRTGREHQDLCVRLGDGAAVTLLVLPALFEEANRMRRFTLSVMRGLHAHGLGTILPDLPGTGESLRDPVDIRFEDWAEAVAAYAKDIRQREGQCLTLAIRGGALLDGAADDGWRLAPETGERLLRDMVRATALSGDVSASALDAQARAQQTTLAGTILSPALYAGLHAATLPAGRRRTARLTGDTAPADIALDGARLWRAAEPGDDLALVTAAVADVAAWVSQCVG